MSNEVKANPMDEISKTVAEIREVLAKSGHLAKADDEMPAEEPKKDEAPAPAEAPAEAPAPEAQPEEAPAPAPEGEPQPEGQPAEGEGQSDDEWEAAMAQHAKEMSDEELDKLLGLLMSEKESRASSEEAPGQEQPSESQPQPEAPAPAPEAPSEAPAEEQPEKPEEESVEKSVKDDMLKLSKSLDQVIEGLAKVSQDVSSIKDTQSAAPAQPAAQTQPQAAAPAKKPTMVSKPVTTSRPQVQVLEKSGKPAETSKQVERLNKSESIEFLIGELKKGNPLVNTSLISDFNYTQSQEEVNSLQDRETKRGVQFPKL